MKGSSEWNPARRSFSNSTSTCQEVILSYLQTSEQRRPLNLLSECNSAVVVLFRLRYETATGRYSDEETYFGHIFAIPLLYICYEELHGGRVPSRALGMI